MACLVIQTVGLDNRPLHLRLGSNRVGRSPDCDFQIEHPSVSSRHCDFVLSNDGIFLRDCSSTNGTFVDGEPISEAWLQLGQTVHLGDVELFVESTEINISIPNIHLEGKFPKAGVGSPVVLPDGTLICARHSKLLANYRCTVCDEVMCGKCVKVLKRQGGHALFLCPVCGGRCGRISTGKKKKKTLIQTVRDTVKLPFTALSKIAKK